MNKINWLVVSLLFLASCQGNQSLNGAPAVKSTPFIPTVQAAQPTSVPTANPD